ncbi:MAG: hypothetical protein IPL43_06885 [Micropruina sp.]|nr:hypothetical protein [Micropruina sp.]
MKATAARWVDEQLATASLLMPWPRALRHLTSLIIKADPAAAARRAEQAQEAHEVMVGEIRDGSTTLFARLAARDGLFLDGMLNRVADVLTCRGEEGSRQQLRAKALGILATPGYATQLLATSSTDQDLLTDERPAVLDLTGIDPDRLLPKTTLYVHIADDTLRSGAGIGRVEHVGAVTLDQVRQFLGHSRVRVVPVLDHDHLPAVDAYEIPDRLREAILLRHTVEAFPWSNRAARGCEQDHTIPYNPQAPPGTQQTRANNLGPFGKRTHRAKTHTDWNVTQLLDGIFHWRSPHGYHALVTPDGTIPLGRERPTTSTAQQDAGQQDAA